MMQCKPVTLLVPAAVVVVFLIVSCGKKGSVDTIVTKTDTLTVHDTLTQIDTVPKYDTIYDTASIVIGKHSIIPVGVLMAGVPRDTTIIIDSCLGSLTAYGNPPAVNCAVSFNGHPLVYDGKAQMSDFTTGIASDLSFISKLAGATYTGYFHDVSTRFTCTIDVPYYATDTASQLSHDTLRDSVLLPTKVDTLLFSHDGVRYDSVDYFGNYDTAQPYRILLNKNLEISWTGTASWYLVQCVKYLDGYPYSGFSVISEPFDTFTVTPGIVIPYSHFYQDTIYDSTSSYSLLYISVLPVNGPHPGQWSALTSFHGNGYLFAIRNKFPTATLNCYPYSKTKGGLTKRTNRSFAGMHFSPDELLKKFLVRRIGKG